MQTRIWFSDLRDGRVIRRALKTSVVVGTLLVAITQGASIITGEWTSRMMWQIPLTVMVPFTVSLLTSATVVGSARRANASAHSRLSDQLEAINKFPNLNPNPVLRISFDGVLLYSNSASQAITSALGLSNDEKLPDQLFENLMTEADREMAGSFEIVAGIKTFSLLPVMFKDQGFINVYGTDVTAMKVLNKFPDQNPNPMLRITVDQMVEYANPASEITLRAIGVEVGEKLPDSFFEKIKTISDSGSSESVEVSADGRTFSLLVAGVFEFGFINLYGTEITASLELEKAHAENELLLLNILPAAIADRLKQGEGLIADKFDDMSVLFADVVGFTQMSKGMSPSDLVEMLELLAGYRKDTGIDIQIRIGMHTGPAVAGVVGLKKFIYDLWGDTVNMASRMESHGLPDRIQVLDSTRVKLEDTHSLEKRGIVDIKGIGPLTTYFLKSRLDPSENGGNAATAATQEKQATS